MPADVEIARERLLGLRGFDVLGHRITFSPWDGPRIPHPWKWPLAGVRMEIVRGTWPVWMDLYRATVEKLVRDWDGLTYDDLWRDPEIGLLFCREVARARR